jgi:hypothetical protein
MSVDFALLFNQAPIYPKFISEDELHTTIREVQGKLICRAGQNAKERKREGRTEKKGNKDNILYS